MQGNLQNIFRYFSYPIGVFSINIGVQFDRTSLAPHLYISLSLTQMTVHKVLGRCFERFRGRGQVRLLRVANVNPFERVCTKLPGSNGFCSNYKGCSFQSSA